MKTLITLIASMGFAFTAHAEQTAEFPGDVLNCYEQKTKTTLNYQPEDNESITGLPPAYTGKVGSFEIAVTPLKLNGKIMANAQVFASELLLRVDGAATEINMDETRPTLMAAVTAGSKSVVILCSPK